MKRLILAFVALIVSFAAFSQTTGSDCANPNTISQLPFNSGNVTTVTTPYNFSGVNSDYATVCGSYVFKFIPTENMSINARLAISGREYTPAQTSESSTPANVGLVIFNGCPDGAGSTTLGTPIFTSGNAGTISNVALTAATEYYFVVLADSLYTDGYSIFGFQISAGEPISSTVATVSLEIEQILAHDVTVEPLNLIAATCNDHIDVQCVITNAGTDATVAGDVTLTCKVNNVQFGEPIAVEALAANANVTKTFTNVTLADGANNIQIIANYTADQNTNNNTRNAQVTKNATIASFPYTEGFEGSVATWTAGGTQSSWEIGTIANDASTIINSSNGNCYVTNLNGITSTDEDSYIVSPCMSFASLAAPKISFSYWANFPESGFGIGGFDIGGLFGSSVYGTLQISTNDGASWDTITTLEATTGWVTKTVEISEYANESSVMLRFTYKATASGLGGLGGLFGGDTEATAGEGIAIDNIDIRDIAAKDLGVIAVTAPISNCGLANEHISVVVKNYGRLAQSNFPIKYKVNNGQWFTETVNATLASHDTMTYVFTTTYNFAEFGNYTIIAATDIAGDEDATNNESDEYVVVSRNIVTEYPYTENFEGTSTDWAPSVDNGWKFVEDAEANNSYYMSDTSVSKNSNITSPCLNFSELEIPEMHIDVIADIANLSSGLGDLGGLGDIFGGIGEGLGTGALTTHAAVLVSTNEGASWDTIARIASTNNAWIHSNISLADYAGEPKVLIRVFYNEGLSGLSGFLTGETANGGKGVAVDNIVIKDAPQKDLGVTAITGPASGCGLSEGHVSVEIKNFGRQAQSNFDVKYSLDNGATWVTNTVSASVASMGTYNYTFTENANFAEFGPHTILAKTALANDEDATNDQAEGAVVSQGYYHGAEVIFDDVYSEDPDYVIVNDWYATGNNSSWAFGKTMVTTGDSVWTWATNPNGPANSGEESYLYSPCYDLSGIENPIIKVYFKYDLSYIDMGEVEDEETPIDPSSMMGMFGGSLSLEYTLNGSAWNVIEAGDLNEGWYSGASQITAEISEPGWSGSSHGFISAKTSITFPANANLTNVKFRFVFKSSSMDMGGEDVPFNIGDIFGGMTGGNGIGGVAINQFIVYGCDVPAPHAAFTYTNPPCTGEVIFTNNSTGAESYAWNFGDGSGLDLGDLTGETGFDLSDLFGDGSTTSTEENPTMYYSYDGTYIITLTATNECGTSIAQDSVTINFCTLVEENAENAISIYPNPASNMITIANAENATIVIVNALGQVVAVKENISNSEVVDLSKFANGTYFVKVNGNVIKVNIVK